MVYRTAINGQDLVVLAAVTGAANAGLACPSNDDILAMTNAASPSSAGAIIKKLERHGLIKVERFTNSRCVTIVETGKQTAAVPGRTRAPVSTAKLQAARADRAVGQKAERARIEEENRLAALTAISAQRETCFRCGVRADFGCKHRPVPSGPHSAAGSPAIVPPLAVAGASVSHVHG